jgi:nucleoside-diphosphate-sugar epimerase
MAEELCLLYLHEFRVQVCIIRPFNIYGPNQPKHFIIPEIIQKILDPNAISLNIKDTKPKRDFLYLDDFISALLLSINAPREIFNVGSGKSVSVKEIIEFVFEITGKKKKVRETGIQRPNEIYDLYADIKRYQKLGWAPSIDIQEGLERCINSEGAKL